MYLKNIGIRKVSQLFWKMQQIGDEFVTILFISIKNEKMCDRNIGMKIIYTYQHPKVECIPIPCDMIELHGKMS